MTVQADILKAIEGIEHGFQQAGQALSERIFHCRQVHGAEIVDARSLSESGRHAADGVFSEGPLAVAVVTADCLPILMSSRDGRVVAALHGGWQGLVAGIVGAAVARFNARGVASADIRVAIGPGIKACCYEVSAGFIEALQVGHGRLWEGAAPPGASVVRSPSGRPGSLRPSQGRRSRAPGWTWWPSVASCSRPPASGRRRSKPAPSALTVPAMRSPVIADASAWARRSASSTPGSRASRDRVSVLSGNPG